MSPASSMRSMFSESELVDCYHPRFRGDKNKIEDQQKQLSAPEPGNPKYFISSDQVWMEVEGGGGPVPLMDI